MYINGLLIIYIYRRMGEWSDLTLYNIRDTLIYAKGLYGYERDEKNKNAATIEPSNQ